MPPRKKATSVCSLDASFNETLQALDLMPVATIPNGHCAFASLSFWRCFFVDSPSIDPIEARAQLLRMFRKYVYDSPHDDRGREFTTNALAMVRPQYIHDDGVCDAITQWQHRYSQRDGAHAVAHDDLDGLRALADAAYTHLWFGNHYKEYFETASRPRLEEMLSSSMPWVEGSFELQLLALHLQYEVVVLHPTHTLQPRIAGNSCMVSATVYGNQSERELYRLTGSPTRRVTIGFWPDSRHFQPVVPRAAHSQVQGCRMSAAQSAASFFTRQHCRMDLCTGSTQSRTAPCAAFFTVGSNIVRFGLTCGNAHH